MKKLLVHQVNCRGVMGAGLALQIRRKYPKVFDSYQLACLNETLTLGKIQIVKVSENLSICNLAGQDWYGRDRQHTDYKAVHECLKKLKIWHSEPENEDYEIRIPKGMGCGLGGGNWETYLQIIIQELPQAVITEDLFNE